MVPTDILKSLYLLYSQATTEKDTNIIETATHSFRILVRSTLTTEKSILFFMTDFKVTLHFLILTESLHFMYSITRPLMKSM